MSASGQMAHYTVCSSLLSFISYYISHWIRPSSDSVPRSHG